MRMAIRAVVEQFRVITVALKAGDIWESAVGENVVGEDLVDTSDHIGFYLSGSYITKYPRHRAYPITGPSFIQPITGRKDRHPQGPCETRCIADGELIYVSQPGPPHYLEPAPLDWRVLMATEEYTPPAPYWIIETTGPEAFDIKTGDGLFVASSTQPLTLLVWLR